MKEIKIPNDTTKKLVNFDVTIIKELLHRSLLQQLTSTLLQANIPSNAHNLVSRLSDFSESFWKVMFNSQLYL
jgi:hypothetical protein